MNAEELLDLGLTWQFKGDLAKAEDYLKKALAQDPELRGAHLALGDIYLKRGRIDMAEDMYSKEIKIKPDSVKAYIELANVYVLKGDEHEALSNFEKALSLSGHDWRASKGIGYIYFMRGELAKAIGWFRMATDGNEEDLAVHFWLALICHQNKLVTEMDTEIEKVKAICKNMEKFMSTSRDVISYVLGKAAALQGRYKEAAKYLEKLRKKGNIKDKKRIEFGLFYEELDILRTLMEVYDKTDQKPLSDSVRNEIDTLVQAK